MTRRGIGANQGVVLAILVAASPRLISGDLLARLAFPTGDRTQGRRVLVALEARSLVSVHMNPAMPLSEAHDHWTATEDGREAFYAWFRNRVARIEGVAP